MTFYERYTDLCAQREIEPCSQRAADLIGTTKATISTWGKRQNYPRGEVVRQIADAFQVSADYLLCRIDDPRGYTGTPGDAETQYPPEKEKWSEDCRKITEAYLRLDVIDQARVRAYLDGILDGEKYKGKETKLA